jgi:hypothetical protein
MQILAVIAFLILVTMLEAPPHADASACAASCVSGAVRPAS